MAIIVKPSVKLEDYTLNPIKVIANAARTCYQSKADKEEDDLRLCKRIISRGHTAMLEFAHLTFRIVTDRGITHELVRHRIASFAQESTRYCNYGNKAMEFVLPHDVEPDSAGGRIWANVMASAENNYKRMLELGYSPQIARSVLPNSLKAEIVAKFNVRSFRNFLSLRLDTAAHPDMQKIAMLCYAAAEDVGYGPLVNDVVFEDNTTFNS